MDFLRNTTIGHSLILYNYVFLPTANISMAADGLGYPMNMEYASASDKTLRRLVNYLVYLVHF